MLGEILERGQISSLDPKFPSVPGETQNMGPTPTASFKEPYRREGAPASRSLLGADSLTKLTGSLGQGREVCSLSLPSEGWLRPPLIDGLSMISASEMNIFLLM